MTPSAKTQMDSGFAWIILCATFFNYTLMAGAIRAFGILYAELLDVYERGSGNTAFLQSLFVFISAIAGMLSGFISMKYSYKWCTVAGGVLVGVGMSLGSLTKSVEMLLLTYSTIMGIGFGLAFPTTLTIINFYFEKRRAFANGCTTASLGVASIVFPRIYRTLIDTYGIHGAMLIIGGIWLNICVGGSLFRQPRCFLNHKESSTKDAIFPKFGRHFIDTSKAYWKMMKNPTCMMYFVILSFGLVGYSANFVLLPPHIQSQHFTKEDVLLTMTVIGATEMVARVLAGFILDLKYFRVQTMYIVTMFIGGIFAIGFPFFKSRVVHIIYAVAVGVFQGNFHLLLPLMLVSMLDLESLPTAMPLSMLISHTACLIGYPFLGWLQDWTGSWNTSFYTVGTLFIISSMCILVQHRLCVPREDKSKRSIEDKDGETDEMLEKNGNIL